MVGTSRLAVLRVLPRAPPTSRDSGAYDRSMPTGQAGASRCCTLRSGPPTAARGPFDHQGASPLSPAPSATLSFGGTLSAGTPSNSGISRVPASSDTYPGPGDANHALPDTPEHEPDTRSSPRNERGLPRTVSGQGPRTERALTRQVWPATRAGTIERGFRDKRAPRPCCGDPSLCGHPAQREGPAGVLLARRTGRVLRVGVPGPGAGPGC